MRFVMGRGSSEIYTVREVFGILESKKVGVKHKYLPKAAWSDEGR